MLDRRVGTPCDERHVEATGEIGSGEGLCALRKFRNRGTAAAERRVRLATPEDISPRKPNSFTKSVGPEFAYPICYNDRLKLFKMGIVGGISSKSRAGRGLIAKMVATPRVCGYFLGSLI